MIPIVSLLIIVGASLVVTRIATVALVHTGLSRESARFQARSAFTGVGFTTSEAESVVDHPVRRRVVMTLMLFGNVGIVTALSSLLLSFLGLDMAGSGWSRLAVLVGGLGVLWYLATSSWIDRHLCRAISWALNRYSDLDARDYARLLHLRDDYGVSELAVGAAEWLTDKTLDESGLVREGVLVLGIECPGGHFIGAPAAETAIRAGDRLVLYGRTPRIAELDRRDPSAEGEQRHRAAISEQERMTSEERRAAGR